MRAAVLREWGTPLSIEAVPDPVPGTGEVIVDVVATSLPSYAAEVFSGERRYSLALPAVPGGGGDWVYCDCTVRSRGEGGLKLQEYFHDGALAERMRMRILTENAVRIGAIEEGRRPVVCARDRARAVRRVPRRGPASG